MSKSIIIAGSHTNQPPNGTGKAQGRLRLATLTTQLFSLAKHLEVPTLPTAAAAVLAADYSDLLFQSTTSHSRDCKTYLDYYALGLI